MIIPDIEVSAVVTRTQSTFNSDFKSLKNIAKDMGIPVYIAEGRDDVFVVDRYDPNEVSLVNGVGVISSGPRYLRKQLFTFYN